jgi:DNA-binding transcriptional regulator GbsR (MarR family)
MTEETVNTNSLPPAIEAFVLRWGDMGGQWGVNRSVAQIQAFLFLSERPRAAEDIAETLGMARSNVSNSLRELVAWKLIRRVPVRGDRRDHYEAEADLWQILTRIARGERNGRSTRRSPRFATSLKRRGTIRESARWPWPDFTR